MIEPPDTLERTWPARPECVAEARHAVVGYARAAGADDPALFGIELAVSEAVTNAIVHGYVGGPAETVTINARLKEGELRVAVRDRGRGMIPRPDSPGLGLGLPLISQMAARVRVSAAEEGAGVELCMYFALTEAGESA